MLAATAMAYAHGISFDMLILREDETRRGRGEGEITGLLDAAACAAGMAEDNITVLVDELAAVRYALSLGQPKALLVIFADSITTVWKEVIYFGKHERDDV